METEIFEHQNPDRHSVGGNQLDAILKGVGVVVPEGQGNGIAINDSGNEIATKYAREDGSIDEQKVYNELARLIAAGNQVIAGLGYVDPNAEGVLSGVASVLASVRQMVADFVKVHSDFLKHKRQIELEKIKQDSRLDLEKFKEQSKLRMMEKKHELDMEKLRVAGRIESGEDESGKTLPFSATDVARLVKKAIDSEAKQEEKEN